MLHSARFSKRKGFFLLLSVLLFAKLNAQNYTNNRASSGLQRVSAFEKQEALLHLSPYKTMQWRLVGPDNRSGRCTDVWGIPGNNNFIMATFATGGIWKTTDGGNNWQPLFDKMGTQSIGTLAIAPSNSTIIYAGTGEANIFRASLPGLGIYKSEDAGFTWKNTGLTNSGTIARIVVDPANADIVYVAASGNEWTYNQERGVYKTVNGGKTWKKILFINNKTGCIDLLMDPAHPAILYASMWKRIRKRWSDPVPEDSDYIYKSTDAGATWHIINKGLPDTKYTGRIGITIAAGKPNVLYAYVDDHNKKKDPKPGEKDSYERDVKKVVIGAAIYRSDDGGENWHKQSEVHDFFKPFSGTYGWVFGQIRVDPDNDSLVYVMGVQAGISEDAGKTWKVFEPKDTASDYIHGDNHGMWIDPANSKHMILGDDGGVSVTFDGGYRWKNFYTKIPTAQFYTVTYDMENPFNIYGAMQDEGSMSASVNNTFGIPAPANQRIWTDIPGGEGTQIRVDPDSSNIIYSSSYYGHLMRSDMLKPDTLRTTRIAPKRSDNEEELRGEWLAATIISKYDHHIIYHGMQYVFESPDRGDTWHRISEDLSIGDTAKMGSYPYLIYHHTITMITESQFKKESLYAGTDDGRVWRTESGGEQWIEITKGLPGNAHVSRIIASKDLPSRLYISLNDRREDNITPYLFASEDNGKTWHSIAANLPMSPVNVVIEDEVDHNTLYCGTDMGIYISHDRGKNWIALNANLPASVAVDDMFIHPRDKKLVIATYGRGIYVLDNLEALKK